jgi:hypothetical protein
MLLLFVCWSSLLKITFSKIFVNDVSKDIGLYAVTSALLPFLCTGTTCAYFKRAENTPVVSILLHMKHRGEEMNGILNLTILLGVWSYPLELVHFRLLLII